MEYFQVIITSAGVGALINVVGVFWFKERLKQSIQHEYASSLEKMKSELEYDLDKRKKLYEGKLEQYKKYFHLFDSYNTKSRERLFSEFEKNITEVLSNPPEANSLSTVNYIKSLLDLQNDTAQIYLHFKNEINGLRLEAGSDLLKLLDNYIVQVEELQNQTNQFIQSVNKDSNALTIEQVQEKIQAYFATEQEFHSNVLVKLQSDIFWEMRKELGIV